jgi:PAS domain S-box-containing protein
MGDEDRSKDQLVGELVQLRQRVAELEKLVAAHKRAERVLCKSEKRLRNMIDSAAEAVSVADLEGTLVDINEAAARLYGVASKEEALGRQAFDFVAPVDRQRAVEDMSSALEHGPKWDVEYMLLRADGSEFPGLISVGVLREGSGEAWGLIAISRDITERKRAEAKLKAQEEHFRSLIENSSDAIAVLDVNGVILYESSSSERLLGYEPIELVGRNMIDLVHPEDLASVREVFGVLAGNPGEIVMTELRYRRKDGSYCVLEGVGKNLIHDPIVNGIVINYRDATGRKLTEEALRQSEERYRLLAEDASDLIWTADTDLRYTYVSPSVIRLRGYTVEEAMGQTVQECITPASLETALRALNRDKVADASKATRTPYASRTLEVEFTCKGGSTVWTETKVSFLRDKSGGITGYLGVTRDISDRKRAEDALRESEAKYSAVVENARDGVVILQDGLFRFVNAFAAEQLGYTVEELQGMDFFEQVVVPELRHTMEERYGLRLAGEQLPMVEARVRTKDGSVKEVEVCSNRIQYHGRPAVVAIVRDIGDRKRAEAERLEHAAAVARTEELRLSRQRIVTLEESLRRDIAQELHGSVQTRLIVLQHRLTELERAAGSDEHAAELAELRQELRDLSENRIRPISRRLYPSILRQGLVAALQSLGDGFEAALPVEMDLDPELVKCEKADRRFIQEQVRLAAYRIAEEGLTNALKHACPTRAIIRLGTSSDGWLHLAVEDNGSGFDTELASNGVGLLMIQDYAEVVGGTCEVRSAPGKGTEVVASLPLSQHAEEPPETDVPLE